MNPRVTAIIPSYQRPNRTQRAIDSVSKQTYTPLELIVVDDGSTPPLDDQLDLPIDHLNSVRLIRLEENCGANVARNTGIERASGEYIAFLDSDDEWLPEKIERQVSALEQFPAQAAYTSVKQIDTDGRLNGVDRAIHSGDLRSKLLTGNEIGTYSSFMVDTSIIADVGKPDPNLPCWQDWEWYLRLAESVQFIAIEEPLVRRHNGGHQISRSFEPKRDQAYPILRDRLESIARTKQERRTAIAHLNYELGYAALSNHEYHVARTLFLNAIRNQPFTPLFYQYLAVSGPHYKTVRKLKRALIRQTS